jgi:hypothetical protein
MPVEVRRPWGASVPDFRRISAALKRLSILASFCQQYNYKLQISAAAISQPSTHLIEGSNGGLSPGQRSPFIAVHRQ